MAHDNYTPSTSLLAVSSFVCRETVGTTLTHRKWSHRISPGDHDGPEQPPGGVQGVSAHHVTEKHVRLAAAAVSPELENLPACITPCSSSCCCQPVEFTPSPASETCCPIMWLTELDDLFDWAQILVAFDLPPVSAVTDCCLTFCFLFPASCSSRKFRTNRVFSS